MSGRMVRSALLGAAALASGGAGVAIYLTIVHYTHQPIACGGLGDCGYVNSSEYAKLLGVPVAALGAGAYISMLGLSAAAWLRKDPIFLMTAWGTALASLAFSIYLTYIELRVLEAICVYCVVSASIITALFGVLSGALYSVRSEVFDAGTDLLENRLRTV